MGPEYKDYYAILGVSKTASEKEIKSAYRKLARKYHPDVNAGDKASEDKFKDVGEAYEALSEPAKRKKYDEYGDQWRAYSQSGAGAGGAGGFRPGAGGGFPGAGAGGYRVDYGGDTGGMGGMGGADLNDLFASLFGDQGFGGMGGGSRMGDRYGGARTAPPRRGDDIESTLQVSLDDAYHGATRGLQMTIPSGRYDIGKNQPDATTRRVEVKIPQGVAEGQKIRLAGQGGQGAGGAGDLFLQIQIAKHPTFERVGDDLNVDVPVPYTDAALGGEIRVPTMKGNSLTMKIPAGTQSGQKFRLAGQGMPKLRGGGHGDLFARTKITVSKQLSDRERELLTELSSLKVSEEAAK